MNIILVLIFILFSIPIGFGFYFLYRNNKVYKFMTSLNNLIYNGISAYLEKLNDEATYLKKLDDEEYEQRLKEVNELLEKHKLILHEHSYEKILYSFKKLKVENWFNEEEVAFLKQCKVWLETTKSQE